MLKQSGSIQPWWPVVWFISHLRWLGIITTMKWTSAQRFPDLTQHRPVTIHGNSMDGCNILHNCMDIFWLVVETWNISSGRVMKSLRRASTIIHIVIIHRYRSRQNEPSRIKLPGSARWPGGSTCQVTSLPCPGVEPDLATDCFMDGDITSPLQAAADVGHTEVIELLVAAGAGKLGRCWLGPGQGLEDEDLVNVYMAMENHS